MTYGEWTTRMKAQVAAEYFSDESKRIREENDKLRKENEVLKDGLNRLSVILGNERISRIEEEMASDRWA